MTSREFALAVKLRIGADVAVPGSKCSRCDMAMDRKGRHALVCQRAIGVSTKGHNLIRDTLMGLASISDPGAVTEAPGLVLSNPYIRPADVLTTAAFGRPTAPDVVVSCPHAGGAGPDAAAKALISKFGHYGKEVIEEMREEGVEFQPMSWTCWGRPHAQAKAAVGSMADAAARPSEDADADQLRRRAATAISIQLWKRAARMLAFCLPQPAPEATGDLLNDSIREARIRMGRNPSLNEEDSDEDDTAPCTPSPTPRRPPPATAGSSPRDSANDLSFLVGGACREGSEEREGEPREAGEEEGARITAAEDPSLTESEGLDQSEWDDIERPRSSLASEWDDIERPRSSFASDWSDSAEGRARPLPPQRQPRRYSPRRSRPRPRGSPAQLTPWTLTTTRTTTTCRPRAVGRATRVERPRTEATRWKGLTLEETRRQERLGQHRRWILTPLPPWPPLPPLLRATGQPMDGTRTVTRTRTRAVPRRLT